MPPLSRPTFKNDKFQRSGAKAGARKRYLPLVEEHQIRKCISKLGIHKSIGPD